MNYFIQILWLLCWPLMIYISYYSINHALIRYKKELEEHPSDKV